MTEQQEEIPGTLKEGEVHPAAHEAMKFVKDFMLKDFKRVMCLKEAFASTAISGNRLSEICLETLDRIMNGKPVSDRYLLGLAWILRTMDESKYAEQKKKKQQPRPFKFGKGDKRV